MSRRLVGLTLDNLSRPADADCRSCVFWELDRPGSAGWPPVTAELEKEAWLSDTLLEWGSCGQLAYVDGSGRVRALRAAGLRAPGGRLPDLAGQPGRRAADDGARAAQFRGAGLGACSCRRWPATWCGAGSGRSRRSGVTTPGSARPTAANRCLLPADYLRAVGFKTVRAAPVDAAAAPGHPTRVTWRAGRRVRDRTGLCRDSIGTSRRRPASRQLDTAVQC